MARFQRGSGEKVGNQRDGACAILFSTLTKLPVATSGSPCPAKQFWRSGKQLKGPSSRICS
jgi:hypothetical protein